jgi:hypothetical protein
MDRINIKITPKETHALRCAIEYFQTALSEDKSKLEGGAFPTLKHVAEQMDDMLDHLQSVVEQIKDRCQDAAEENDLVDKFNAGLN